MSKKIAMVSALGGQGCTLSAAYVGNAMAESGRNVTMLDLCGFGGNLADVMGASEDAAMNLGDVIQGACECEDAMIECEMPGLRIIPPSLHSQGYIYPYSPQCRQLIENLSLDGDVICDIPSGAVPDCDAVRCFDIFVICSLTDRLSLKYASALCRIIKNLVSECGTSCEVRLLLTKFSPEHMRLFGASDIDECIDTVGARLLGVVPYDLKAEQVASVGEAPNALCDAMRYARDIAGRICGEKIPLESKKSVFR